MNTIVQKIPKIMSKEWDGIYWFLMEFYCCLGGDTKASLSLCTTLCEKHDCFNDATVAFVKRGKQNLKLIGSVHVFVCHRLTVHIRKKGIFQISELYDP